MTRKPGWLKKRFAVMLAFWLALTGIVSSFAETLPDPAPADEPAAGTEQAEMLAPLPAEEGDSGPEAAPETDAPPSDAPADAQQGTEEDGKETAGTAEPDADAGGQEVPEPEETALTAAEVPEETADEAEDAIPATPAPEASVVSDAAGAPEMDRPETPEEEMPAEAPAEPAMEAGEEDPSLPEETATELTEAQDEPEVESTAEAGEEDPSLPEETATALTEAQDDPEMGSTAEPAMEEAVEEPAGGPEAASAAPAPAPEEAQDDPAAETEEGTLAPEEGQVVCVFDDRTAEVLPAPEGDDSIPDDLLYAYIEQMMRASQTAGMVANRVTVDDGRLDEACLALYRQLKPKIGEIAAGQQSSTEMSVTYDDLGLQTRFTASELGIKVRTMDDIRRGYQMIGEQLDVDYSLVQLALLANCPYELYWYDKTAGAKTTATPQVTCRYQSGDYVYEVTSPYSVRMSVSEDYRADTYQVDTSVGQTVQSSVRTAQEIVGRYSDLNDLEKLGAYRDEICGRVSYNGAAAREGGPYGDPWQLIYVFDGNDDTNVVCEGYAKAFQYLCDMTAFDGDVNCSSVTGTINTGAAPGAHMWNIVTMSDGRNYLVDVTNSDAGTLGADGSLFLNGYTDDDQGYTFTNLDDRSIRYQYDDSTRTLYTPPELVLAGERYRAAGHLDLYPRHTMTEHPRVEATCTEAGHILYWTCDQDGGLYADARGAVSLTEADLPLAPTGHDYGAWVETLAPGCETPGVETRVCAHDATHTETRPVSALGHAYGEWTVTTAPGCETPGVETRVCAHDAAHTETRPVAALGHAYGEWTVTTAPGCETPGVETRVCAHDAAHTETQPVAALGHAARYVPGQAATYAEEGWIGHWVCDRCGRRFADAELRTELTAEDIRLPMTERHITPMDPEPILLAAGREEALAGWRIADAAAFLEPAELEALEALPLGQQLAVWLRLLDADAALEATEQETALLDRVAVRLKRLAPEERQAWQDRLSICCPLTDQPTLPAVPAYEVAMTDGTERRSLLLAAEQGRLLMDWLP